MYHFTFDQQDFAKTQNLYSNDVVVTLYDVITLVTRWKLNKLGINCAFSKYLLNSFNCKNVTVGGSLNPPPPQSEG